VLPDDSYCEACGTSLPAPGAAPWRIDEAGGLVAWIPNSPPTGVAAGEATGSGVADQGRVEVSFSNLAGVSDRGFERRSNDDAMAVASMDDQGARVLVVCDGVATSTEPASASRAAARAALANLVDAVERGQPDLELAMGAAVGAAHRAVCAMSDRIGAHYDPPATTLVAAVVRDGEVTVGWVGDSRAYLFDETDGWQLTRDHSWAAEQVRSGLLSEAEAATDPRAHALTGWLGGDVHPAPEPSVVKVAVPAGGRLVLCTDGLWNYAPGVVRLRELVLRFSAEDPLEVARELTKFALSSGGEDNITVAVALV
jgi:serine/threonine protein phosphatase PrpC